ncbi:MAG: dihydrofolate reductase family protein, partial [Chloroflexota bacterium]
MRKLVVTEFVSIDGVIEDPGGVNNTKHGGWVFEHINDDIWKFKLDEMLASEAHLLGRRTYEEFAGAWPYRSGDEMADYINAMKKYVVSTTLETVEWNNSHIIKENVAEEIRTLKKQSGKDLLVAGSAQLVTFLSQE